MTFSDSGWLIAGLAACLALLWMWRRYDRRQHQALAQFVSPHLRAPLTHSVSRGRRRLQRALMLGAVAMTFVALAGPLLGFRWEWISRRGIQIMFAMDTSRSMSTPDVRPDRLTRAKLAIDDFTRRLDGDAIGLIAFAGDAFVVCPVTLDYGAFHESLNAVDVGTIPRGGTNISMAIEEAQAALRRRSSTDKILILITDGENLEGDALVAAKNAAKEDGLRIYTIGVGTAQGDLIPLGPQASAGFLKDESGNFVRSRLDEPALQAIAGATGGLYAPLGAEGQGFETIYQQSLAPMLKHDLASRRQRVYIQRYQWPLSAALVLLLASLLVGNRRRFGLRKHRAAAAPPRSAGLERPPPARPAAAGRARAPAAVVALILLAGLPAARTAHASTASAKQAYERGDFTAAAAEYAAEAKHDPQKPTLTYNLGTAQYRAGDFAAAAQAFQTSINRAPSGDASRLAEQEDAYYDLGNTLYRAGQRTEQSNPKQTLDNWDQAVKAYETALAIRPTDADSKYNRDFVKRKIDELKKQQKNNPQNQGGGGGGGGGQGGQGQQNQPPQNQPPQNQPPQGQPPGQQPPPQNQGQPPGQNQNQPPNQGQNPQPPRGGPQNQPPQNQPPQGQPPQGQPPQNRPGQPNAQNQPPQNSQGNAQPPPSPGSQPPSPTPPGKGSPQPANGQPQNQGGGNRDADSRRVPGQMSPEEARQLLDSEKGDERSALGIPYARRGGETPPDKPEKDW